TDVVAPHQVERDETGALLLGCRRGAGGHHLGLQRRGHDPSPAKRPSIFLKIRSNRGNIQDLPGGLSGLFTRRDDVPARRDHRRPIRPDQAAPATKGVTCVCAFTSLSCSSSSAYQAIWSCEKVFGR